MKTVARKTVAHAARVSARSESHPSRVCYVLFLLLALRAPAASQKPDDHFEKKVRPLLHAHCVKCHGPDMVRGGLRLDTAEGFAKGGESGPAVVAGDPDKSRLVRAVRGKTACKCRRTRNSRRKMLRTLPWTTLGPSPGVKVTRTAVSVSFRSCQ